MADDRPMREEMIDDDQNSCNRNDSDRPVRHQCGGNHGRLRRVLPVLPVELGRGPDSGLVPSDAGYGATT